jgi:cobalt-zinc-cadmium efflux system protein
MAHDHDHAHLHGSAGSHGRAFLIGVVLNLAFVAVEYTYGVMAHSLALLADATHNLGDVLSLVLAWGASVAAQKPPSARYTYGLRGSSILAALTNAVLLLLVTGGLIWEAVERLATPQPFAGEVVMGVAACGVVLNGMTAWLFMAGSRQDLNVRGAYLHMLADAAVSLGVVAAGGLFIVTGWRWLDPLVTLLVALLITWSSWGLLRDSVRLALQAVPAHVDIAAVRDFLASRPGVSGVHDLHIWAMSTAENALTAHLLCPDGHPGDAFLQALAHDIEHRFGIQHVTVQIELGDAPQVCALSSDQVI